MPTTRLRVYAIARGGGGRAGASTPLTDISGPTGIPVLEGEKNAAFEPMGIALYKRPRDGAIFAIVAPKTDGETNYLTGNREGIGIYARPDGRGFIVCSDQRPNGTVFRLFAPEGEPGAPHTHRELAAIPSTADSTDGLDVTATPLGARFPHGLLVAMNSKGHNFFVYRWDDVAAFLSR